MYLWAAAFSGTVVWLSIQKTVQRGNSNHHGAPIFVFVIITALAVAVLLLLSMPRLRWWQRPRLAGSTDAGVTGASAAADAGIAGAGTAKGAGAGPVLESTVLESTVLESTVLESPVLEFPGLGSPALESPVLGSPVVGPTGPGGSRLTGMTAEPTASKTGSVGQAPDRRGRLGRASAEPGAGTPPFAAPPFAAPPLPAPPMPAPALPAEPGSRAASQDWPTRQPAGYRDQPVSPPGRPPWQAGQATPNRAQPVQSLAFWRNPTTGLPATGQPPTGLPGTGRSVIGTPPPAVSGPQGLGGGTHRASSWRPEILPPGTADGNKTEPDGLS